MHCKGLDFSADTVLRTESGKLYYPTFSQIMKIGWYVAYRIGSICDRGFSSFDFKKAELFMTPLFKLSKMLSSSTPSQIKIANCFLKEKLFNYRLSGNLTSEF